MKITIRLLGIIGVLLFGAAFFLTFSVPGGVEQVAEGFIKERIEQETHEKIAALGMSEKGGKLAQLADKLRASNQAEVERLKQGLRYKADEKLVAAIAKMRDLSCECRKKWAQALREGTEFRITTLQAAEEKLEDFMQYKYMEVTNNLVRDLRIFSGSNLLVFALLLLVSFLKPGAIAHLFLPGVLLAASTVVCSYFYLFRQNWFFTLVYNDFVGYGYLAYVGVVFAFFCDIVFNRARVTTQIINTILSVVSNSLVLVPC